ncbi:MAG: YdcH family protein [Alphaproteobacteria bacterium]
MRNLIDRIEVLASKHSEIEAQILAEERQPQRDEMKIAGLKRSKLRIKDEIHILRNQTATAQPST